MSEYSLETKIKAVHDVLKLGMSSRGTATINVKNSHMTIFTSNYCHKSPSITFVLSQNIKSIVLCH